MPVNASSSAQLELELVELRRHAASAGITLQSPDHFPQPDYVLDEDGTEKVAALLQSMAEDGVTHAWMVETRLDDSLEDDRLTDALFRRGVPAGALLSIAIFWTQANATHAWDLSTTDYVEACEFIEQYPTGLIHVDEAFIDRMHAQQASRSAEQAESRKAWIAAQQQHSPYYEGLVLADPVYRSLPRNQRMARAREILAEAPAPTDAERRGKHGAADRAYRRADGLVRKELSHLAVIEFAAAFREDPRWIPTDPPEEQREQAQVFLMEHQTNGWRMPNIVADRLVAAARRHRQQTTAGPGTV